MWLLTKRIGCTVGSPLILPGRYGKRPQPKRCVPRKQAVPQQNLTASSKEHVPHRAGFASGRRGKRGRSPTASQDGTVGRSTQLLEHFFADDNVLYLYSIQRALLEPVVEEQVQSRDGLQHCDITWRKPGAAFRGSGSAGSKKAARREAARQLLREVPISEAAVTQTRKQLLNGLLMRLGAEAVEDGPAEAARPGEHAHRTVWRARQAAGDRSYLLTSLGSGRSPKEAQVHAWEGLYLEAVGSAAKARRASTRGTKAAFNPKAKAEAAARQENAAQGARDARFSGQLSALSAEAAGDLASRHNAVVQRLSVDARLGTEPHQAGFRCVLDWRYLGPDGSSRAERTEALGSTKRAAKGEVARAMLVAQGHLEDVPAEAFNQAARIRALCKGGDGDLAPVIRAACDFLETWPPGVWGLMFQGVWQLSLTSDGGRIVTDLGSVLQRRIGQLGEAEGVSPELWEELLDACAYATCEDAARRGLGVLGMLRVATQHFPSRVHRDYFQHFRGLVAWERVGGNLAATQEIRASDGAQGVRMAKVQCVLPFLTLETSSGRADELVAIGVRAGSVVYLQRYAAEPTARGKDHLASVTSLRAGATAAADRSRLTLRCATLAAEDLDTGEFLLHGLDSEATALRMSAALRALVLPAAREGHNFTPAVRNLLLGSYAADGDATSLLVTPGDHVAAPLAVPPDDLARRLRLATEAAASRGTPLTAAQEEAVRRALAHPLTLIQGPPGTGKTTVAACVVLAWRSLGEKVLCVADSNAAAQRLHDCLTQWGVRALRFSLSEPDDAGGLPGSQDRSRRRPRDERTAYERLMAMRRSVSQFQVVVSTCASAGHELLQAVDFPRVLVDECTQATEPSTLVPLGRGCSHLVLVGDHRQLPPTVLTEEARSGGLARSLFERLADGGEGSAAPLLLDEQRRMHPSIAAFPNESFYGGRIRDHAPERPPIPGIPWPRGGDVRVLLVEVPSEGEERTGGRSLSNAAEVQAVLELAASVVGLGGRQAAAVAPEEVSVITPYVEQRRSLQAAFAARAAEGAPQLGRVRVATVDGFQDQSEAARAAPQRCARIVARRVCGFV